MHSHQHSHHHSHDREKNIKIAALLNISFTVIEIIGGLLTNSLAILSDALHDFGDSVALIFSLIAEKQAKRPADHKRTYGYQRLSLFSAFFTGTVLLAGSLFILSEAIPRLLNPEPTNAVGMMGLAVFGIVVNGLSVLRLKKGKSQNEQMLMLHMLEDVLGWVVILVGGVVMHFWENYLIDPLMTLGFTLFVIWGTVKNMRETLNIFMQGTPSNIDLKTVKKSILMVEGVLKVHDVHIWSLEGEKNILSAHVVVETPLLINTYQVKNQIREVLEQHNIVHSTLELEADGFCSGKNCDHDKWK